MSSFSGQHSSEHIEDDQSSEGSVPINNTDISDTSNKNSKSGENMVSLKIWVYIEFDGRWFLILI